MTDFDSVLGAVYEAGALPERWPDVLERLARYVGATGGNIIVSASQRVVIIPSPSTAEVTREFDAQGWNTQNTRVSRLIARADHPGFLTDADLHTAEELRTLPMYTEFLTPRGADAGAATVISGADDDAILVTLEAFDDHDAARQAVPLLDRLRPHLARAAALSSQMQDRRITTLVEAFNLVSMPVAMLDVMGRLISASDTFVSLCDDIVFDSPRRMRLHDAEADKRLSNVLRSSDGSASIAIRNPDGMGIAILHVMPARRDARDILSKVAYFVLISRPGNDFLPSADVVSALFDLTPSEARVARGIAFGRTATELARDLGVSYETVRSHLKKVFAKTSTRRQSELALLMARFR